MNPASPILVNLIRIEDEPKAIEYQQKIYMKKKYGMGNLDWLFE